MTKLARYLSIAVFSIMFGANSYAENKEDVALAKTATPIPAVEANTSMMRPDSKNSFKDVDSNSDNKISFDELFEYKEKQKRDRAEKEITKMLSQCDKNKDGMISKDELTKEKDMMMNQTDIYDEEAMEKRIKQQCMFPEEAMDFLDENSDGSVTREEMMETMHSGRRPSKKVERKREEKMQKREAKRKEKKFTVCDTNSDSVLSLREVVSMKCGMHMFTEEFDKRDVDNSNYLSLEELTAYMKPMRFRAPGSSSEAERRKKMPPLARLESSMYECDTDEDGRLGKNETIEANCEQDMLFFDSVDHNQDGYVSADELQRQRMKKHFNRMDKNKDGELDQTEFKGRIASRVFY